MVQSSISSEEIKSNSSSSNNDQVTVIHYLQAQEFLKLYKEFEVQMMLSFSKKCYAVSKKWFDKFKQFGDSLKSFDEQIRQANLGSWNTNSNIEIPAQYPGPIMNFQLVDVEQPYLGDLYSLDMNNPQSWIENFQDWSYMKLKNDIERNKDFVLVSLIIWQKLIRYFGGAPEIGFYLVDRKHIVNQDPQGSESTTQQITDIYQPNEFQAKEIPDLNPIIVKVNCVDGMHKQMKGILVSKHIGVKNFLNSISGMLNFAPTKVSLYKAWVDRSINQIRYEQIQNKGASALRLIDHQIDDIEKDVDGDVRYKLFILQTEGIAMNPQNKLELIQSMKYLLKCDSVYRDENSFDNCQDKYFDENNDKKEVQRMYSPQKNQRRNGQFGLNLQTTTELLQPRQNQDIPEEYANDPDLYFAIQASLGVFEEKTEITRENLTGWDNYTQSNENPNFSINAINRKTPSTDEEFSAKNNQSLDLGDFEMEDEDQFMRPDIERRGNNNTPKIFISALEDDNKKANTQQNDKQKTPQQTKQEKMKIIREQKKDQFLEMRDRARREVKGQGIFSDSIDNRLSYSTQVMAHMGPIKSFGELKDSILKLRENFDAIVLGKIQVTDNSPLKKKDLLNDFESGDDALGGGSQKNYNMKPSKKSKERKKNKSEQELIVTSVK
ncbi:UNKNOWN [Stylonychia lemnae]|uniref:DUSP domain-containing protein n=1 Tax=Stylonychia lemnae TaxID=5949 RepID=A0A078B376_STYLE|nr:UNKNOWN [Stylonychia lemnae]|eukprot:CDW87948.1 UNKNOWN [Stylonychia lemnae]